jgi:hypothetical protein
MDRSRSICRFVAIAALGTLAGFAAHAKEPRPSPLEAVPGLQKRLTYSDIKIPLGEFLSKVAADTGVSLQAAADVADEPVAVVVREFPARELLEQLADLLDYQWSRREKGPIFEVSQDLASKEREEALRQAWIAAAVRKIQEEVRRTATIASLPPAQILDLLRAEPGPKKLAGPAPGRPSAPSSPSDERARQQQLAQARRVAAPVPRVLAGFLAQLTPKQWAALVANHVLVFSPDPNPSELPLPEEISGPLRSAKPTLFPPGWHVSLDDPQREEEMRQQEKEMQAQWAGADGYRLTISLETSSLSTAGWLALSADAEPMRKGSHLYGYSGGPGMSLMVNSGPMDVPDWETENTPERCARLERDPVVGAKKRFRPEAKPMREPFGPASQPAWRFQDLLPDLARTYDVQFLGDAYYWSISPPSSMMGSAPAEPIALSELLDRYGAPSYRWQHQGHLIRLRSRTWFFDRPHEIPLRTIRRWRTLHDQYAALPLEEYVRLVASLSDAQWEGLPRLVQEVGLPDESMPLDSLELLRQTLRLYASLSLAQQRALWQGRPAIAAQMGPAQRQRFLAALQEFNRHCVPPRNLEQWEGGGLSAVAQSAVRSVTHNEKDQSLQLDPEQPASGPRPTAGPASNSTRTQTAPKVTRHSVTEIEFRLQYGPQDSVTVGPLVTALSGRGLR